MLTGGIHPLVLGAVNRSRNQIRFLAKTLLAQHIDDQDKINSIVKMLVEERFSHDYLIGRKEAKRDLKLNVIDVSNETMEDIMSLYYEYDKLLQLDIPYNFETALGDENESTITLHRCIIESKNLTHTFSTKTKVNRIVQNVVQTGIPTPQYQSTIIKEEWMQNDEV